MFLQKIAVLGIFVELLDQQVAVRSTARRIKIDEQELFSFLGHAERIFKRARVPGLGKAWGGRGDEKKQDDGSISLHGNPF